MTPLPSPAAEVPDLARPPRAVPRLLRPFLAALRAIRRDPARCLAIALLIGLIGFGLTLGGLQLWASYHLRAARRDMARYHYNQAGDHLQNCLYVRGSSDSEVLLLTSRAARCSGLFDQAEDLLDRYQKLRGHDATVTLERALLRAERGDIDDVLKWGRALVAANDPASPLILEALTRGSLRAFRLPDALWAVQTWNERDPDNAMGQLLRGRVARERGADSEAGVAFRRALEIDPELDDARDQLATLLVDTYQGAEAKPHLEYLVRRRPDDLGVKFRLAKCYHLLGEQEEAIRLLDEVLARKPHYAEALSERGKLALNAGEYKEAEPRLREAYELALWDPDALENLRKCLDQSGQKEKLKELEPQIKKSKENREKLEQLRDDIQRDPHDADAQYQLGVLLLELHSYGQGLHRLENTVQIKPQYVKHPEAQIKAHKALADFYQRIGESGKAARHQKLAREAAAEPAKN